MDRRAGPKVAAFAEAAKRWDLACATWGCEGRVEIDLFVGVADPELAEEMVDVVEAVVVVIRISTASALRSIASRIIQILLNR